MRYVDDLFGNRTISCTSSMSGVFLWRTSKTYQLQFVRGLVLVAVGTVDSRQSPQPSVRQQQFPQIPARSALKNQKHHDHGVTAASLMMPDSNSVVTVLRILSTPSVWIVDANHAGDAVDHETKWLANR